MPSRRFLKRIWTDPVWSNVIAGGILALIPAVAGYMYISQKSPATERRETSGQASPEQPKTPVLSPKEVNTGAQSRSPRDQANYPQATLYEIGISHGADVDGSTLMVDGKAATLKQIEKRVTVILVTRGAHAISGLANGHQCTAHVVAPTTGLVPLTCLSGARP